MFLFAKIERFSDSSKLFAQKLHLATGFEGNPKNHCSIYALVLRLALGKVEGSDATLLLFWDADGAESFLVAYDILLEGTQQALGMFWGEDDTALDLCLGHARQYTGKVDDVLLTDCTCYLVDIHAAGTGIEDVLIDTTLTIDLLGRTLLNHPALLEHVDLISIDNLPYVVGDDDDSSSLFDGINRCLDLLSGNGIERGRRLV